jgi:hypothetical protein
MSRCAVSNTAASSSCCLIGKADKMIDTVIDREFVKVINARNA